MQIRRLLTAFTGLLSFTLSMTLMSPVSASRSTESVNVQLSYVDGSVVNSQQAIVKNGVSYISSSLLTDEYSGLALHWDRSGSRAEFHGLGKSFAVRIGSPVSVLDGITVQMGTTPFREDGELFLPAKFVVKALGGTSLAWDSTSRTVKAGQLHRYGGITETFGGKTYSLSTESGDLFVSSKALPRHKLANLGEALDIVDFNFEKTPKGMVVLKVWNTHRGAHASHETFTLWIQNESVIHQASLSYMSMTGADKLWTDGRLLFNDGTMLRILEDGSGAVLESINLAQLMREPENKDRTYIVQAMYPDYALIAPADTGILTLVDRHTGEQTELYRELYGKDPKKVEEVTDPIFPGDRLTFTGRSGDKLNFTYSYNNETETYAYTIPVK